MARFTLYGSPHSLPTYKVALMLHMSGEPFSFRYVSFQKGTHKTPEFLALSRWGQVPVLVDSGRVYLQATAIVEHLAETLRRFQGSDPATRQLVREWLYWEVDVLFPPIFNCYGIQMGKQNLLPISVEPAIADYHRRRAEAALSVFDSHLAHGNYLCSNEPPLPTSPAVARSPSPRFPRSIWGSGKTSPAGLHAWRRCRASSRLSYCCRWRMPSCPKGRVAADRMVDSRAK